MSIKELKKKEKEERRNYIIDAAEELFFKNGYDDVSMGDIANEVDVNRATLYLYFKNKEEIYSAIVLRAARILDKMFKESVKSEKKAIDKFNDLSRAYFDFYKEFPDYYDAYIYFKSPRFIKGDNEYMSEIKKLAMESIKIPCELAKEGIEDGSMRKDLNPLEMAIYGAVTSRELAKLDSWAIKALESQGISYDQFIEDSIDLWRRMLINTENKDLK